MSEREKTIENDSREQEVCEAGKRIDTIKKKKGELIRKTKI